MEHLCQGFRHPKVFGFINLKRLPPWNDHGVNGGREQIARGLKDRGPHTVNASGLFMPGPTVLAPGALLVRHPPTVWPRKPEVPIRLCNRNARITAVVCQGVNNSGYHRGVLERRRILDEEDEIEGAPRLGGPGAKGVTNRQLGRHLVASEFSRAFDNIRPEATGHVGDLGVVGRDHDVLNARARAGGPNGAADKRHAADLLEVFARNTLASAPGQDDRQHLHPYSSRQPSGMCMTKDQIHRD
jgi:hypothetical protein